MPFSTMPSRRPQWRVPPTTRRSRDCGPPPGLDAVPCQAAVSVVRSPRVFLKVIVGPLTRCRDTRTDEDPVRFSPAAGVRGVVPVSDLQAAGTHRRRSCGARHHRDDDRQRRRLCAQSSGCLPGAVQHAGEAGTEEVRRSSISPRHPLSGGEEMGAAVVDARFSSPSLAGVAGSTLYSLQVVTSLEALLARSDPDEGDAPAWGGRRDRPLWRAAGALRLGAECVAVDPPRNRAVVEQRDRGLVGHRAGRGVGRFRGAELLTCSVTPSCLVLGDRPRALHAVACTAPVAARTCVARSASTATATTVASVARRPSPTLCSCVAMAGNPQHRHGPPPVPQCGGRPGAGRGRRCRSAHETSLTIRSAVGTRPVTNG